MRIIARPSFALGLAAVIGLIASAAANAQAYGPGYGPWGDDSRYRGAAYDAYRGGIYNAYRGGAYNAYRGGAYNAYRGGPESFSGTSVPYNPSGPGWNDFQLQGR